MSSMIVITFVWLFILHFIADFVLQSRAMSVKKSEIGKYMLQHISIQLMVFAAFAPLPIILLTPMVDIGTIYLLSLLLAVKNATIHFAIDGITWNVYKVYYLLKIEHLIKKQHPHIHPKILQKNIIREVKRVRYWEDKLFYDVIGFDQLLHAITILIVYQGFFAQ